MGNVTRLYRSEPEPPALSDHAIDNLRFIRKTMAQATSFTAISGWSELIMGVIALAAAVLAGRQGSFGSWLAVWLGAATVSLAEAIWLTARKARTAGVSLSDGPARKCVLGFCPPALAGAAITFVLIRAGVTAPIPGLWLLMYGASVVTGGAYSVRALPAMGCCFMVAGAAALVAPASWSNWLMAAGFGGLHLAFGAFVVGRHGG